MASLRNSLNRMSYGIIRNSRRASVKTGILFLPLEIIRSPLKRFNSKPGEIAIKDGPRPLDQEIQGCSDMITLNTAELPDVLHQAHSEELVSK